jgi:charged multivesicular body protein 3
MEKVMNILKPKPNPQEILRDWQRKLRQESRNIERQIRGNSLSLFSYFKTLIHFFLSFFVFVLFNLDIQREEKNVQKAIKEAAKRNDIGYAKV